MVNFMLTVCILAMLMEKNYLVSAYVVQINSPQLRPRFTNNFRSMCTMTSKENSHSTSKLTVSKEKNQFGSRFLQKTPTVLKKVGKYLFPLILQISVMVLFSFVSPALAKKGREIVSKGGGNAAAVSKAPPFWRRIIEGANTSGVYKSKKAGDTRGEFAALLNSISSFLIMGSIFFLAFLRQVQREKYQEKMMRRELGRIDEYKVKKV